MAKFIKIRDIRTNLLHVVRVSDIRRAYQDSTETTIQMTSGETIVTRRSLGRSIYPLMSWKRNLGRIVTIRKNSCPFFQKIANMKCKGIHKIPLSGFGNPISYRDEPCQEEAVEGTESSPLFKGAHFSKISQITPFFDGSPVFHKNPK